MVIIEKFKPLQCPDCGFQWYGEMTKAERTAMGWRNEKDLLIKENAQLKGQIAQLKEELRLKEEEVAASSGRERRHPESPFEPPPNFLS